MFDIEAKLVIIREGPSPSKKAYEKEGVEGESSFVATIPGPGVPNEQLRAPAYA